MYFIQVIIIVQVELQEPGVVRDVPHAGPGPPQRGTQRSRVCR